MQAAEQRGDAAAGQVLAGLQGFSPPQRSVNTVTTYIPGPQHPLYLVGRQMLEVVCTGTSGQRSVDPAGGER
jgi:hypothetical protein